MVKTKRLQRGGVSWPLLLSRRHCNPSWGGESKQPRLCTYSIGMDMNASNSSYLHNHSATLHQLTGIRRLCGLLESWLEQI